MGGSTAAAPIARDIILQAMHGGEPPLTAYPESQRTRIESEREELQLMDLPPVDNTGQSRA